LADGWHQVVETSFDLDSYEFIADGDDLVHGGGSSGICAAGFTFKTDVMTSTGFLRISGPLTSILAVESSG